MNPPKKRKPEEVAVKGIVLTCLIFFQGCATCTKSAGRGYIDTPSKKVASTAFLGGWLVGIGGVAVGIAGMPIGLPLFLGGWSVGALGMGYLYLDEEQMPVCKK